MPISFLMHFPPMDNFSGLTVSLDHSGIVQDITEPCEVLGPVSRTLPQQAFLNLVHPAHAPSFESSLAKALAQTGFAESLSFDLIRPDGSCAELQAFLRHARPGFVQLDARLA